MMEQTSHANRRRRWWLRALTALREESSEPSLLHLPEEKLRHPASVVSANSLRHLWRIESGFPDGLFLRLFRASTGQVLHIPLVDPSFLVGQGPRCQLRLLEPGIADHEIALVWAEGNLWRIDLQPERLPDRPSIKAWQPGDEERWGSWQVSLKGLPRKRATSSWGWGDSTPQAFPSDQVIQENLVVELDWNPQHQRRPSVLPMGLSLVGAGHSCEVLLPRSIASTILAAFIRTESSLWLVHLASTAASRVNGQEIQYAALDPGDVVEFGDFSATVRLHWSHFPGRRQTAVRTGQGTAPQIPAPGELALRKHWAHFQQVEQQLCQLLENVSDIDAACIEQFKSAGRHCQQALETLLEADRPKEKSSRHAPISDRQSPISASVASSSGL